jgi:diguanylate cyclase (GGDEF)-like protein/PAS domain S-box-containing protein
MEDKITKSAGEWENTFNAMTDLVFLQSVDFTITKVNKAFADFLKKKPEEIVGKKCYELLHGRDSHWPGCPTDKVQVGKLPVTVEVDDSNIGIPLLVTSSPIFGETGELVGTVHIAKDISELKKAENERIINYQNQNVISELLRISFKDIRLEEVLHQFLDLLFSVTWLSLQSKGAILLIEEESRMLVMRAQRNLSEEIKAMCAKVVFGRCICGRAAESGKIMFVDSVDELHENRYEGIIQHGHYCIPIIFKEKIMGVINLYVQEGHIRNQQEEDFLNAVAIVLAGIIDRKLSEEAIKEAKSEMEIQSWGLKKTNEAIKILYKELEEKTKRVQELDKLKSEFISTVSHELRTPLSITKEGISLVLDRIPGEINEKQERLLTTAKDNIDRLARIINSLLDISKIEAGKLELRRDLVNLADIIKLTLSSFAQKAMDKSLELKTNLATRSGCEVYADADKIIQVFTNLVNNALKFTDKGGIEIRVEDKGNMSECSVIDTGRGIDKENLPKVFSKFQQFGRTEGGGERGTGLGLSIAKGLVEMHHGTIWIESELGKGSKFIFTLPKYTTENIIKENLVALISDASDKNKEVSLIIMSIVDFDKVEEGLSKARAKSVLQKMTEAVRNSLRRSDDMAFSGLHEIVVILSGCNKENALRIEGRLSQVLEDYLTKNNLSNIIKLKLGTATYPDEAPTEEALIDKARHT